MGLVLRPYLQWSDNGQISKTVGGYKNGCISETISLIELKLSQNLSEGVFYAAKHFQVC